MQEHSDQSVWTSTLALLLPNRIGVTTAAPCSSPIVILDTFKQHTARPHEWSAISLTSMVSYSSC